MTSLSDEARSQVLPPNSRVAIVAGEGRLPLDVAIQLAENGMPPFIVVCGRPEETAPGLLAFEHRRMEVEEAPGLVPVLKRQGITHAVLAGAVVRRPRLLALRPRRHLFGLALTALRSLRRGDDALLRAVVGMIERSGIRVVGAHDLVPDLLAAPGLMTQAAPNAEDERNLASAFTAARALGALDVGQAAVAVGGRVIALEGIEGTDGMLERVQGLRGHGRIANAKRGVLVKCAKPEQELRADLPTIGPDTIQLAAAAGLTGIGLEAGRSLILEKKKTIAEAHRLGLFIVGLG